MSDKYDEKAQFVGYQLQHIRDEEARDKIIAQALRLSAAEAFEEAATMCNEKFGQGVPGNMTPALYAKAAALRKQGGS